MSGHTPGPWGYWEYDFTIRQAEKNNLIKSAFGAGNNMIVCSIGVASSPGYYPDFHAAKANAQLIAAAPELLKALEDARELLQGLGMSAANKASIGAACLGRIDAAIVKAKGGKQ